MTTLTPGLRLGQYTLEGHLGEGGMGTVFRALDTKLNRPVAIKFLSDSLADAPSRRRFQREAQMASSLNHPHILTVYDTGEFEGRHYLVTEFVDGGTLADWAKREKRTWRQVVELLSGIADGLTAAHDSQILHRDIKPANILISKSGYAKLADFGLAKLVESATDSTRTLTQNATQLGAVIGTLAYMSPEQASGSPLDARSDIFSVGVVLYEMVAGRRPFVGKTHLELVQNVINATPEPLSDEVPASLRETVGKALEKDPADRYQSMRELVVDLRRLSRRTTVDAVPVPVKLPGNLDSVPKVWLVAATLAVVALAVLAIAGWWRPQAAALNNPATELMLSIVPTAGTLAPVGGLSGTPQISPDGSALIFDGPAGMQLRRLNRLEQESAPRAGDAMSGRGFWSPDSKASCFPSPIA